MFSPWVGKVSWRRKCQPTPVFLLGESHGQRRLVGYSPWGRKESDIIEQLSMHTHMFDDYRTYKEKRRRWKEEREGCVCVCAKFYACSGQVCQKCDSWIESQWQRLWESVCSSREQPVHSLVQHKSAFLRCSGS